MDRILKMKEQAEAKGLKVLGIESVNIHDAIKVGSPEREKYMLNNLERIADHADNLASSVESDHRDNRLLW